MTPDDMLRIAQEVLHSHGIDPAGAEAMAHVIGSGFERTMREGEPLCREGEPGNELWVLLSGKVRVSKRDYLGLDKPLAVVAAPALLGQLSTVDGSPRSATCTCAEAGVLVIIDGSRIKLLMRDLGAPGDVFRRLLISSMSRQLTRGNAELRHIVGGDELEPDEHTAEVLAQAEATFEGWR